MSTTALSSAIDRRPVLSAAVITALDVSIVLLAEFAAKALLPAAQPDLIALVIATVWVVALVSALGWWDRIGFISALQNPKLLILPAVVMFALPLLGGANGMPLGSAALLVGAYLLVGFREETLFRGVILKAMESLGPWKSVLLAALFFGLAHATNFAVRASAFLVLAQMVGATADAVGFGALRMKSVSLWPLIVLHAGQDLLLKFTVFNPILTNVVQVTIMLVYGLVLLRNRHTTPVAKARAAA